MKQAVIILLLLALAVTGAGIFGLLSQRERVTPDEERPAQPVKTLHKETPIQDPFSVPDVQPATERETAPTDPLSPPGENEIRIHGTAVFDDDGTPVSGAEIGFPYQSIPRAASTDQDGAYAFNANRTPLQAFMKLTCYTPGYALAVERVPTDAMKAETVEVEVNFRLVPGGSLSGRVVLDRTGEGLQGVRIDLTTQDSRDSFGRREEFALQAKSGPDGAYTFDGLARGIYAVYADGSRAGFPPTDKAFAEVEIRDTTSHTAPDLVMTTGATLTGIVLNPQEEPVPGAELSLAMLPGRSRPQSPIEAVSDAGGNFALKGLAYTTPYRLTARAEGYAPTTVEDIHVAVDAPPPAIELRLDTGATIAGHVILPDGSPVPSVTVSLGDLFDPTAEFYRPAGQVETNLAGHFAFDHLAPGKYEVSTRSRDYATTESSRVELEIAPNEPVPNLELTVDRKADGRANKREANFRGVVLAQDRSPVPDARVQLLSSAEGIAGNKTVKTDSEGRFEADLFAPGLVDVVVKSEKGSATAFGLELGKDHTLVVDPRIGISGQVVGPDGAGIPACEVYLIPDLMLGQNDPDYIMNLITSNPDSDDTATDAAGNFLLRPVKAGTYVIEARCSDFVLGTSAPFTVEDYASRQGIRVRANPGATLRGTVVDAKGEPVSGARVSADRAFADHMLSMAMRGAGGPYDDPESVTDTQGAFVLHGLAPGRYQINARHTGYAPAEPVEQTVQAGETVDNVRVVLLDGGCISGVLDQSWQGHFRNIRISRDHQMYRPQMKPDGSFELCGLPPGTYVATIHTAGEELATTRDATYPIQAITSVQVYDGKDTPIHFPPRQPRASLEIDFLNNPVMWGLCLTADADPEAQGVKMMTQGTGAHRIHEIPPGNYTLSLGRGMMCDRGEYVEHLTLSPGEHVVLEIDLPEE